MFRGQPFIIQLIKTVVLLVVSFNALMVCLFFAFFGFLIFIVFAAGIFGDSLPYDTIQGDEFSENRILSIPVNGIILGDRSEVADPFSFLSAGITFGYEVKQEFINAAEDDSIDAIVLEINSPGGTIYGSQAIVDGINYYREQTDRPVIAHVSGLAASGAYMAATPADYIFADKGSSIGSIGVILGPIKYYDGVVSEGDLFTGEVTTENGIESDYITAGKSKDLGNPYRRLTPEERNVLQTSVNNEYDEFVTLVTNTREIPENQLRDQIGALIFDNKTAQGYKLIDESLNKQEAYMFLADKLEFGDDYQVIQTPATPGFFESLMGVTHRFTTPKSTVSCVFSGKVLAFHGDVNSLCQ